jgi:hypothetical protein
VPEGRQGHEARAGSVPQEHRDHVQPDSEAAAASATPTAEAPVITSGHAATLEAWLAAS